MTTLHWFKSSYSGSDEPDCVEVATEPAEATVHVRDSKAPDDGRLSFTGASWRDFLGFAVRR
ncbi:DUF397 domain-containing protein [Streptomyces sp. NPDC047725]|uniref:DUF397 domain-containing protein n=1 Tax=Streptomyces sp. NPDC047725 TaxID=3365487 RepID=UPI003723AD39